MQVGQKHWTAKSGWTLKTDSEPSTPQLVLAFGGRYTLDDASHFATLREFYPDAHILMASTSGEIADIEVHDESIVATAIQFEKTQIKMIQVATAEHDNSYSAGAAIAKALQGDLLQHVFVIADGQEVNGSELAKGINEHLPDEVSVTGGLAGDGPRFEKTLVGLDQAPSSGNIVGVGFYSEHLQVGFGSMGGWDPFGPERKITKSKDNILYELDGESALGLYKRYLGEQAQGLPGTALLFPLSVWTEESERPLVRTILSVDEENQSMIFAGDVPQGASARLMKANFDRLIDGASEAARQSNETFSEKSEFAILISCVGRKLVLGQHIEDEVEIVQEVLGEQASLCGFYSYGEISPVKDSRRCELHNQTMTITTFKES
mgnify:CR=1 FL=1